jgi:hypothetical protein
MMPTDLDVQIRALFDDVEPVSADEARAFAARRPAETPDATLVTLDQGRRRRRVVLPVAAAVLVVAVVVGVVSQAGGPGREAGRAQRVRMVLTAAQVNAITTTSTSAAASSGTAHVTQLTSLNGTPQSNDTTAVTFDGANVDEKIGVTTLPTGAAKVFSTDDRLVDGQFYIYTPGPSDVPEWMHDTDSAGDTSSMQFPDPRTLYAAISPRAQFEAVGTSTVRGTTLTHLRALDPEAIPAAALGNLVQGGLSSFDMWVTSGNVVEEMAFSSAQTVQACSWNGNLGAVKHLASGSGSSKITEPATSNLQKVGVKATCGPQKTASQVTVTFADLGQPETIAVPQGAVDFSGKG